MKKLLLSLFVVSLAVNAVMGLALFNHKAHAAFHGIAGDRGHRGFDMVDEPTRQAMIQVLALGGIGLVGRFKADVADQILMDDGETVLNVMDRSNGNTLPGNFISVPVEDYKHIEEAGKKAEAILWGAGHKTESQEVMAKSSNGTFKFIVIHSDKLTTLIVLRPSTWVLGQPDWIPLVNPLRIGSGGA